MKIPASFLRGRKRVTKAATRLTNQMAPTVSPPGKSGTRAPNSSPKIHQRSKNSFCAAKVPKRACAIVPKKTSAIASATLKSVKRTDPSASAARRSLFMPVEVERLEERYEGGLGFLDGGGLAHGFKE